jgi:LysM repeat protein
MMTIAKRVLWAALVIALLLVPLALVARWGATYPVATPVAPVGTLSGAAEVRSAHAADWSAVHSEVFLHEGDTVRAAGEATLTFPEGSVVRLSSGAEVEIATYAADEQRLILRLLAGAVEVQTGNPRFRLDTPSLTASQRSAIFRAEVRPGEETYLATDQGSVQVQAQAEGRELTVEEGNEVQVSPQRSPLVRSQYPPTPTPIITRVPTPTPTLAPTAAPTKRIHIVASGDTLSEIALKYNTTVDAIVKANNLESSQVLSIGQTLIIP